MTSVEQTQKAKPLRDEILSVLRRVLAENIREYYGLYALAAVLLLAVALSTALIPWVMRPLIDDVFYREQYGLVPLLAGAMAAVFTVRGLATYGQAVILAKIGNNLVARYQQRIFDHLMRLGLDFYAEQRSAQLAAKINENVLGIRNMLSQTLKAIASDAVMLVALVGAMIAMDPMLSLIVLFIGPPLVYAVNKITRRLRSVARQSVEVNARLVGAMQEATQGIAVVKAFTMEEQLARKMSGLVSEAEKRANKIVRVSERVGPITEVLAGLAVAGIIMYASYRSQTQGVPPGSVFAFITAMLLAYDPARKLARVQVNLERSLVNARMIYELLDTPPRQRDRADAVPLKVASGEVRFDRVSFGYVLGTPVLHDVSFVAAAGKMTAIVGGSGAGKSTVVSLIERFYDLSSGAIIIDGQNIAGVTRASLRRNIAYVSQHPYLFEGTLRENIRYGRPDASDAEVEEAARLAYVDDFVQAMPQRYDTPVGENGVTLSGGQRQRLSIARAILRNAPILLLDEATSALDAESESRVQAALEMIMKDRTTIVIAHRLSTIVKADRIVVMEEGRVVEEGTHARLMSNPAGVYARFHRLNDERRMAMNNEGGDAA